MATASLLDEQLLPRPGHVLCGRYRLREKLAEGAMGSVYLAEQVRLGRLVAVQFLATQLTSLAKQPTADESALRQLQAEAEILSHLRHPHVVEILDFDTTEEGVSFLVMEYISGESLTNLLERQQRLPLDEALRITLQAGSALREAHENGIVHRDLKPASLLITWVADGPFVRLFDFGISKRSQRAIPLTGTFEVLGTLRYMSPEQALGHTSQVDHRCDQFSLAVILVEMLTGSPPSIAESPTSHLAALQSGEFSREALRHPEILPALKPVLERALSYDPNDRFPTIQDFLFALRAATGRESYRELRLADLELDFASTENEPSGELLDITAIAGAPSLETSDTIPVPAATMEPELTPIEAMPSSQIRVQSARYAAQAELEAPRRVDVLGAIALAEEQLAQGHPKDAFATVLAAHSELGGVSEAEAQTFRSSLVEFLRRIVTTHLGGSERRVRRLVSLEQLSAERRLKHEELYLVTLIDGRLTPDELADISPQSALESWLSLAALAVQGAIAPDQSQ